MRSPRLASSASTLFVAVCAVALVAGCGDSDVESDAASGGAPKPSVGDVEVFAELPANSEGLAFGRDGEGAPVLYVGSNDSIVRVRPDGAVDTLVDLPSPVGMALREDGDLLVCGAAEGGGGDMPGVVWRVSPTGEKSLFVGPGAFSYKVTNFVAVAPDDSVVFTDSGANKVYRADPDGGGVALVTDTITYPNGLAFSKDGKTLFVASWDAAKVMALPRLDDGGYGAPEVFIDGVLNVDGLALFGSGDLLLVTSGDGLVQHGASGDLSIVPGSQLGLPANAAFGEGVFGEGWAYVTNLFGVKLWRAYVGEGGAPLPVR